VPVRTLVAAICSSAMALACATTPALAAKSGATSAAVAGGAMAGSINTSASGGAAPSAKKPAKKSAKPIYLSPVTAKTASLAYSGPVYEKTATGEVIPYAPSSAVEGEGGATGGVPVSVAAPAKPQLLVPGVLTRYVDGLAAAPMGAPASVQEMVWAGNQLVGLPYIYGGGHQSFVSPGYDCSGTVSFALHGGDLLQTPEDSSELAAWGSHGAGRWVTIFANGGHAYMTVAGLRLDTSAADDPSNQQGPRWRPLRPANEGYTVRHPLGL
jgi:cell wall-associated NlpC family hydrolase